VHADRAVLLTDKFVTKDTVDPVRVRLELKEVDEALDHFGGDPASPEYAELVHRELWAATQLEIYGDPPPPRIRPLELAFGAGYKADETEQGSDAGSLPN
jgi:F-type H+-transporting ATPase subunit epsilon